MWFLLDAGDDGYDGDGELRVYHKGRNVTFFEMCIIPRCTYEYQSIKETVALIIWYNRMGNCCCKCLWFVVVTPILLALVLLIDATKERSPKE